MSIRVPRDLQRFYVLAFGISWLGYLPLLLGQWGVPGFRSHLWLGATVLMGVGPAVAAWLASEHRPRLNLRRPTTLRWLLFASLTPAFLLLISNSASRHLATPGNPSGQVHGWALANVFGLMLIPNLCEEIGWRSFALRRLLQVWPGWLAAGVVGLLWALWHLPLFLYRGVPVGMAGMPWLPWVAGLMAQSYLMLWLWRRTAGSVWGVTAYHLGSNVWAAMFGVRSFAVLAIVKAAAVALLWVVDRYRPPARSSVQNTPNLGASESSPVPHRTL